MQISYYSNNSKKVKWEKWASYSSITKSSAGGKVKSYKKRWGRWVAHYTTLDITVSWSNIRWDQNGGGAGGDILWSSGSVRSSDSNGWIESTRKNAGTGDTPTWISGLKVKFYVGGVYFSK